MTEVEIFKEDGQTRALIFGKSLDQLRLQSAPFAMPSDVEEITADAAAEVQRLSHITIQSLGKDERTQYVSHPEDVTIDRVLLELGDDGKEIRYRVLFQNGMKHIVTYGELVGFDNGQEALAAFRPGQEDNEEYEDIDNVAASEPSDLEDIPVVRRRSTRQATTSMLVDDDEDSTDELFAAHTRRDRRSMRQPRATGMHNGSKRERPLRGSAISASNDTSDQVSSDSGTRRRSRRLRPTRTSQKSNDKGPDLSRASGADLLYLVGESGDEDQLSSDEDLNLLQSDVLPRRMRKRKRTSTGRNVAFTEVRGVKYRKVKTGTRQSDRTTRHQKHMGEVDVGDIYRSGSDAPRPVPKAVGAREAFQPLPSTNRFHLRHCQQCDTCGKWGGGPYGQLVHCQGCSLSYHKHCLGTRSTRDHLVTKVGEANFVLQCRRCISFAKSKDKTLPDQGMCQQCREPGPACGPFRKRNTPGQEEKEREENDGEDPVVQVKPELINNVSNVLFRCTNCWRAFHYHHLRSRNDVVVEDHDEERIAEQRFKDYSRDFMCIDCADMPTKVSGLVAWRPVDPDMYMPGAAVQDVEEDLKEYLIKWEGKSHYQCRWMPGAWVWGVTAPAMRKAFAKRVGGPTMNTEDAIPEDYLRIDIILEVRFTSIVETRAEEVDKARIREVDQALMKFKGLGYEDAVWEKVPDPEDGDRWSDFVTAYDDWVLGRYVKAPKLASLRIRLDKTYATEFSNLEKKKQPEKLVGGELMKYQVDGLNWLYYRWWSRKNAILADEMGLGKTIQIIGFLATLVQDHNCFPFLVVVPNSTVANWRREIKQWAPSLRIVTYFGSAQARRLAYQHELYPDGAKELRCHIVVTSYEAAADESCRKFFRSPTWQGLIVDEGQRLKSDSTILYEALTALKVPFKILLTGTPLQNNARELFNLLQFLDESFDASALEVEYTELTKDNVPKLHELIRPFFLRRTKAQVLTFLPPMGQIVLPVSMSSLQAKLYKSILSRNPELIKALYDTSRPVAKGDRASLNNILMQLRKCLCHPFVYSNEIEEITHEAAASHRNLVEASAKLQLLEVLLPKLHERGHRVLIFSQFLDMLNIIEDFMDGLALGYKRLDGTIGSMEKQKRIDAFNAPDSPLFAFLLSTRAGGVGINLATADTVIIMDPDFNPHRDIQALSRAHRIGQKNKVLCFQLMTRATVEEKIVQVGRKKMALDHVLIEQMDKDEDEGVDVESILRFGAADILEGKTQDIRYEESSIEKLLDRSVMEDTKAGEDNSAESQFSFARVWANDTEDLADGLDSDVEKAPDQSVWDRILKEREQQAAEEAAARHELLGRGRRARQVVDYSAADKENVRSPHQDKTQGTVQESDSDTDFHAEEKKSEAEDDSDNEIAENVNGRAPTMVVTHATTEQQIRNAGTLLNSPPAMQSTQQHPSKTSKAEPLPKVEHLSKVEQVPQGPLIPTASPRGHFRTGIFRRAEIRWPDPAELDGPGDDDDEDRMQHPVVLCPVCRTRHRQGFCPLKLAGPEFCNLCGLAHYGQARSCPHIRSETMVRDMLNALKLSPEMREHIELAKKYLTGVKGTLVQEKKKKAEKAAYDAALRSQQAHNRPTASGGASSGTQPSRAYAVVQNHSSVLPPGASNLHGLNHAQHNAMVAQNKPPQVPQNSDTQAQEIVKAGYLKVQQGPNQRHSQTRELPIPGHTEKPWVGRGLGTKQVPGGGQYTASKGMPQ